MSAKLKIAGNPNQIYMGRPRFKVAATDKRHFQFLVLIISKELPKLYVMYF